MERDVNDDELGPSSTSPSTTLRPRRHLPARSTGRPPGSTTTRQNIVSRCPRSAAASSPRPPPSARRPHPRSLPSRFPRHGYALKLDGKVMPLTGLVPPDVLIDGGRNTIIYEQDPAVRDCHIFKLFSTNHSHSPRPAPCASSSAASRSPRPRRSATRTSSASSSSSSSTPTASTSAPSRRPRPHRPPRRPAPHPLRHLQPLLPRRSGANPPG